MTRWFARAIFGRRLRNLPAPIAARTNRFPFLTCSLGSDGRSSSRIHSFPGESGSSDSCDLRIGSIFERRTRNRFFTTLNTMMRPPRMWLGFILKLSFAARGSLRRRTVNEMSCSQDVRTIVAKNGRPVDSPELDLLSIVSIQSLPLRKGLREDSFPRNLLSNGMQRCLRTPPAIASHASARGRLPLFSSCSC